MIGVKKYRNGKEGSEIGREREKERENREGMKKKVVISIY